MSPAKAIPALLVLLGLGLPALAQPARHRGQAVRAPVAEQFGPPAPGTPYDACDAAIATAQRSSRVPVALLPAISRVESGRMDPATRRVRAWPWTINVEGVGSFFDTKEQVVAAVTALQARGVRSIDVGCMQVNLMHHPRAFPSLDAAFDPQTNAAYAARFLTALYGQFKDWNLATAAYHSQDATRGEEYQRLVFGRVMTPMGPGGTVMPARSSGPYAVWPPAGSSFAAIPPVNFAYGAFGSGIGSSPVLVNPLPAARKR